jgi:hypothetical protein
MGFIKEMTEQTEQIKLKICGKCKIEKPISEFYKRNGRKDGTTGNCKVCSNERCKAYREANKEKIAKRMRPYTEANKEKIAKRTKAYVEANKEVLSAKRKAYRDANAEVLSEKSKLRYAANAEAISEKTRAYYAANSEAILIKKKEYAVKNAEVISEKRKAKYEANKESMREKNKAQYAANRNSRVEYAIEYEANRLKTDPFFALIRRIRRLVSISLTKQGYSKKSRTYEILGCSFEQFKAHIENQFVEGMGWHNRNEWHLDHVYPVSKATDEAHLIALNHYTNFQPLWARDNMLKSDKIPDHLTEAA